MELYSSTSTNTVKCHRYCCDTSIIISTFLVDYSSSRTDASFTVLGLDVVEASPEPDAKSSLTDFGNFVGVESVTATSMPTLPTSSAADLAGVDDSVAATTANKQATKDDIMALYGSANNSAVYNMPGNILGQ